MKGKLLTLVTIVFIGLSACARAEVPVLTQPGQQPTLSSTDSHTIATSAVDLSTNVTPTVQASASTTPVIDGSELLDSRCSVCHSTTKVTSQTGTDAEWEAIVAEMIGRGANLNDEEKAALIQYLAEKFK